MWQRTILRHLMVQLHTLQFLPDDTLRIPTYHTLLTALKPTWAFMMDNLDHGQRIFFVIAMPYPIGYTGFQFKAGAKKLLNVHWDVVQDRPLFHMWIVVWHFNSPLLTVPASGGYYEWYFHANFFFQVIIVYHSGYFAATAIISVCMHWKSGKTNHHKWPLFSLSPGL